MLTVETPWSEIGISAVSALLMGGVVYFLTPVLVLDSFVSLSIVIVAGIISYGTVLLVTPQFRNRINTILDSDNTPRTEPVND
jgi:hypothetical protein